MISGPLTLKDRLRGGHVLQGLFITEFLTPNLGTILELSDYDFCIFDMEHGSYTTRDLSLMVPGFRGLRCRPLVRVPAVRREFFQSALDQGVSGFVVPMIETAEDVRKCLDFMMYPPNGKRGLSFSCPITDFQVCDRNRHTEKSNDNLLLVVQIETTRAFENLKDILSVPGIDVAFIGNADLALSFGQPNDIVKGPVHDAIRAILKTAVSQGIAGGGNFPDPDMAALFYGDGLRFISLDTDIERFIRGLRGGVEKLRKGLYEKLRERGELPEDGRSNRSPASLPIS